MNLLANHPLHSDRNCSSQRHSVKASVCFKWLKMTLSYTKHLQNISFSQNKLLGSCNLFVCLFPTLRLHNSTQITAKGTKCFIWEEAQKGDNNPWKNGDLMKNECMVPPLTRYENSSKSGYPSVMSAYFCCILCPPKRVPLLHKWEIFTRKWI